MIEGEDAVFEVDGNAIAMAFVDTKRCKVRGVTVDCLRGHTVEAKILSFGDGKTRVQDFEGKVLAIDNGTKNASGNFTVSRDSYGVRVERLFPFSSPAVEKVVVVKKNASWRSKLYTERTFCSHKAVRKLVKK